MSVKYGDSIDRLLAQLDDAVAGGETVRARQLVRTILREIEAARKRLGQLENELESLLVRLVQSPMLSDTRNAGTDRTLGEELESQLYPGTPPRPDRFPDLQLSRWGEDDSVKGGSLSVPPEPPAAPAPAGGEVYPVYFGTNRKPAPDGVTFTSERDTKITRGRVMVHVPEAHRFGETGSSFWQKLRRLDFRDDRLRILEVRQSERDAFLAEIRAAMDAAREGGETPHALFFLHGYNCSFESAAIRAAQIGRDLKVAGATAFFSWPSRASELSYTFDEATIEGSEKAITDFLVDFALNCGAEKVHVIAHSMGNRGLLRALQRIAANAEIRGKIRFGQIFLAAPDVDRDLFLDLAGLYPQFGDRTTLYSSRRDLAVYLSTHLHDAPRAGFFTPYTVADGIDTVAVPNFNVDLLGHSYFAQAEALLHDIFDLIRHGQPPQKRQRLDKTTDGGLSFWKLRR